MRSLFAPQLLGDTLKTQCTAWPTGKRPADFHTAWTSDIPTLITSGELDPVTPPRYGEQVLRTLSNGRHLTLKGQGHGTFAVGCMPKLLGRFLETADATGVAAAVRLAHQLSRADLTNRIAARVASTGLAGQDAAANRAEAGSAE